MAYFYNLLDRQVEVYVNENMPGKYFVGLGLDQKAPDHSTLTVFRNRRIKQGDLGVFEVLLAEIVQIALASGIKFGSLQVIDSVHSEANVNPAKDKGRKHDGKDPRDPDAKWGAKGKQKAKDQNGKEVDQVKYFFGYKGHVSMNAESNLITSLEVKSGEVYDDGRGRFILQDSYISSDYPLTYADHYRYWRAFNHVYVVIFPPEREAEVLAILAPKLTKPTITSVQLTKHWMPSPNLKAAICSLPGLTWAPARYTWGTM